MRAPAVRLPTSSRGLGPQRRVSLVNPVRRMSRKGRLEEIPIERRVESFADDLNTRRGIVSGRVALLPRSTEIQPSSLRFVPPLCLSKKTQFSKNMPLFACWGCKLQETQTIAPSPKRRNDRLCTSSHGHLRSVRNARCRQEPCYKSQVWRQVPLPDTSRRSLVPILSSASTVHECHKSRDRSICSKLHFDPSHAREILPRKKFDPWVIDFGWTAIPVVDHRATDSDGLETSWEASLCHRDHFDSAYAREILPRKKLTHGDQFDSAYAPEILPRKKLTHGLHFDPSHAREILPRKKVDPWVIDFGWTAIHAVDHRATDSDGLETSWEASLCHRDHFDSAYAREILPRKKVDP
ncbi:hypothetical protein G2W53_045264 [Senna tora]|uniref:Uncharacterized protein n=1 Tax=Senna tora TaxID=362788 RepID=A0A834SDE4_9FABA|nr:hypothetical protein G2W53_045264 [Senna tora]